MNWKEQMNEISFRDKIVALQKDWLQDQYNEKRSKDFWFVMDSISDELATKWAERAVKCGTPINNAPSDPQEWLDVCDILNTYKNVKDMKLTPGQKRKCIFHIIRYWDNLEMDYYC